MKTRRTGRTGLFPILNILIQEFQGSPRHFLRAFQRWRAFWRARGQKGLAPKCPRAFRRARGHFGVGSLKNLSSRTSWFRRKGIVIGRNGEVFFSLRAFRRAPGHFGVVTGEMALFRHFPGTPSTTSTCIRRKTSLQACTSTLGTSDRTFTWGNRASHTQQQHVSVFGSQKNSFMLKCMHVEHAEQASKHVTKVCAKGTCKKGAASTKL